MPSASFGQRLAALRQERGLKQEELAKKIGVSVTHVGRYEREESQPTLNVLKRMAKVLGVSLDYLVFDEKEGVAAARLADKELLEQFEKLMRLSEEDKQTVRNVIAGLVVKSQLNSMIEQTKG